MTNDAKDVPLPIVINDTSVATLLELVPVIGRYVVVVVGALGAIFGFAKTRDLAGLIQFFRGADAAAAGAAVMALAGIGTALYKVYVKRRKLIVAADAAPNSKAIVNRP